MSQTISYNPNVVFEIVHMSIIPLILIFVFCLLSSECDVNCPLYPDLLRSDFKNQCDFGKISVQSEIYREIP